MEEQKLSYRRAFFYVILSTFLISGPAFAGWFYYQDLLKQRKSDPGYAIVSVIQGALGRSHFKTEELLKLLNLSDKEPVNLYRFDTAEAEKKLLASPLMRSVSIKKKYPNAIYIFYEMRDPIAYVGALPNTVIDKEGVLFPFHPYYTPKKLPLLQFSGEALALKWGDSVPYKEAFELSTKIIHKMQEKEWEHFFLSEIALPSSPYASISSEILVTLHKKSREWFDKEKSGKWILKMDPKRFEPAFHFFLLLKEDVNLIKPATQVEVDFRLPSVAYVKLDEESK